MKSYIYTLLLVILASLTLTSCFSDEETEYSDYCNISGFSLGSVKVAHHLTGSKGQDSVYYTTYSASSYPVSINQRELTIENPDSLPYGSMVNKMLVSCSFESVLIHRVKDDRILDYSDAEWTTFSSSDSLDFTKPREFMVIASDGVSTRRYTVKVNVHQMNPDETVWDSLGVDASVCPAACQVRKMAVVNGDVKVLTQSEDGSLTCHSRSNGKTGQWQAETMSGADDMVLETLQNEDGMMYASTHEGSIIYTADGKDWRIRMLGTQGLRMVGVSSKYFYALVEGKLMRTSRDSENWQEEKLDDDPSLLPEKDITMLSFTQKNGNKRLLLSGKTADGKTARLWSKMWTGNGDSEESEEWVFYSENDAVKIPFPVLDQSSVMYYDNRLLLFGGTPVMQNGVPLDSMYCSRDCGATWQRHETMVFDSRMTAKAADATLITSVLEDGKYIWILIDDQLWRGRYNGVSYK